MSRKPRTELVWFVIAFDHDSCQQIYYEEYNDGHEAFKVNRALEKEYSHNKRIEVVLLAAFDAKDLHVTHPQYFDERTHPGERVHYPPFPVDGLPDNYQPENRAKELADMVEQAKAQGESQSVIQELEEIASQAQAQVDKWNSKRRTSEPLTAGVNA